MITLVALSKRKYEHSSYHPKLRRKQESIALNTGEKHTCVKDQGVPKWTDAWHLKPCCGGVRVEPLSAHRVRDAAAVMR